MRYAILALALCAMLTPAGAATLVVYPDGNKTVTVPASQYINVFTEGGSKAYVYKNAGYPNAPDSWQLETNGEVADEETSFGPYTYATEIKIVSGADRVLYSVGTGGAAVPVSRPAPAFTAAGAAQNITGLAAAQGGSVTVKGGPSSTSTNAGGALALVGGTPGATGVGGAASLTSGAGGSTSGASGAVTIASGTTTAGSGSATGAVTVQSGAGAASAAAVAGGASGAVTLKSQAGGANTGGATGQAGGAGGAVAITGGAGGATNSTGAHAGGAGAAVAIAAGAGGNASAGTGNGGAGGNLSLTPGSGGTSSGGTAGLNGIIRLVSAPVVRSQGNVTAETTADTLTASQLLNGIITGTHSAGATVAYTLPTGTLMDAATQMSVGDAFEWSLINLSAAAADTITLTAGTDHTIVGVAVVASTHSTTGGAGGGSSARWLTRKTATNTFVTYRLD